MLDEHLPTRAAKRSNNVGSNNAGSNNVGSNNAGSNNVGSSKVGAFNPPLFDSLARA